MISFSSAAMRRRLRMANQTMPRMSKRPTSPQRPNTTPERTLLSRKEECFAAPAWPGSFVPSTGRELVTVWFSMTVVVDGWRVTVLVVPGAPLVGVSLVTRIVLEVWVGGGAEELLVVVGVEEVEDSVGVCSVASLVVVVEAVVLVDDVVVGVVEVDDRVVVLLVVLVVVVVLVGKRPPSPPLVVVEEVVVVVVSSSTVCLRTRRAMRVFTRSIEDEEAGINECR
jgi:hypothetical protein